MNRAELPAQFLEDGYCYLEGVIPPDEVGAVKESVEADVLKHSLLPPPQGFVPGFLAFNQAIVPYLASPRVLDFVTALFGPHARISMLTGMVNASGVPRGDIHADWPYNQNNASHIPAPYPDATLHILTMWMLTDFTEEMGGTIIVPGSHRRNDHPRVEAGQDPKAPVPGERQLTGKAGTVAVFDTRMWHAVAPNRTNQDRVAVIVRYAPWWLNLNPLYRGTSERRTIVEANNGGESLVTPISRKVYESLPPEVQALVGHNVEAD